MPMSYVVQKLGIYRWISMILGLVFIFMIAFTPSFSQGHTYNHIVWILFLASISITIYPYFKAENISGIVDDALVSTAFVFILMSILVYYSPDFFASTYGYVVPGLIIGLLAIILISLYNFFIEKDIEKYKKNSLYISYFVIMLFSVFVSYDTSHMFEMAKICVKYPNYPKSSVNFFLDLLNLFTSFINIYSR